MKKLIKNKLLRIGLCGILLGALAFASFPADAAQPFNNTNVIAASTTITSWPTNTIGTNNLPVLTGGCIGLQNQRSAMLVVQGIPLLTNATTFTITLVRSGADGPPQATATRNDFDTSAPISASFTLQNSTAPFCWSTNLDTSAIGDANWVGIYSMTPGSGSGVSNFVVSLNKKIMTIRYP